MSWHRVILTNPAMAQTAVADLLPQWQAVDEAAGRPADAIVYREPTLLMRSIIFPQRRCYWPRTSCGCLGRPSAPPHRTSTTWKKWKSEVDGKR
jgi:hypothetical protein